MVNILTDEIKNTRLILTMTVLFIVSVFGSGIFILAYMGKELPDFYQGAITTILGFLIGLVTQAFMSYFKNQEEIQQGKTEVAKLKAAAECP